MSKYFHSIEIWLCSLLLMLSSSFQVPIQNLTGDAKYKYFGAELNDAAHGLNSSVLRKKLSENMVLVKGGTFTMGCTSEQGRDCLSDEKPIHQVILHDFSLSKCEVTVKEFQAFIYATNYHTDADREGNSYIWNGSGWKEQIGVNWRCDAAGQLRPDSDYNHPVIHVSWNDAVAYCNWLAQTTGQKFRLPTEAEWEYAARGGSFSRKYKYAGSNDLGEVAWCNNNSGGKTHQVGQKKANELGLYDMNGNVWEWCQNWYDDYHHNTQTNPTGATSGSYRVYRGGGWYDQGWNCRVSTRNNSTTLYRNFYLGFRLAL